MQTRARRDGNGLRRRARRVLVAALVVATAGGVAPLHAAPTDFAGTWRIDGAASDPADKKLDKIREFREWEETDLPQADPRRDPDRGGGTVADHKERAYWAEVQQQRANENLDRPVDIGLSRAMITAETLVIVWNGAHFEIDYAGRFRRIVSPNPAGRVYSASGRELVNDGLGHGLAYWDGERLMIETTTHQHATIVEELTLSSDRHELRIRTKMHKIGWAEPIDLARIFRPTP